MAILLDQVKSLLSYDEETGAFRWLRNRGRTARAGDIAGCVDERGYRRICISGRKYRAHRLVFLLKTGAMPEFVDHINGVRDDNRWCNLRPADATINARNAARRKDGKHVAVTGVGFMPRIGKWRVRVGTANGQVRYLGVFECLGAAIKARKLANIDLGYHENHGRL